MIGIILILFISLFAVFFFYFLWAFWTGAPFLPTPPKIVEEMVRLADIKSGDEIADLGSGDGRILVASARLGAKSWGWEINPALCLWTKIVTTFTGLNKLVTVYCGNYRKANLKKINKLFLYSIADKIEPIEKIILRDMKKGSLVVSFKFSLPRLKLKKKTKSGIFIYIV